MSSSRYVRITIGKHERRIYFNHTAIADLEAALGYGMSRLFTQEMSFHATRMLLWAGLKHEDRGLTVDRASLMVEAYLRPVDEKGNGGDLETLNTRLMEAIKASGLFKGLTDDAKAAQIDDEFEPPPPADVVDESMGDAPQGELTATS